MGNKHKIVDIKPGLSATQIADELKRAGVIRSKVGFVILSKLTQKKLYAGEYKIERGHSLVEIFLNVARGDSETVWVTIPEGYTVQQIANLLESKKLASSEKFMRLVRAGISIKGIPSRQGIPDGNLEGYLFPDTYKIGRETKEEDIIKKMVMRFQEVTKNLQKEAVHSHLTLSWRQLVILASLIEREAKKPEERPLISAVLQNRLRKNMKLECDATVQYALGAHKNRLTYKDLEISSAYNTYKIYGLPPTPICNPGKASIEAAVKPDAVDYLFYVAKPDGSHIFSRTYHEHLKAIEAARMLHTVTSKRG